jgi:DNA polymerase-4
MPRPETWARVIAHGDMDAFFASVEQMDHPELRGRPVLVGGTGRRGVVSTASYEARPFGCRSAMPMAEARRLCPQAVVLPPNFRRYQEVSERVMEVFSRFSPLVEPLSLDEAFLDLTGCEGLFGPPEAMGRRLKNEVRLATGGLTLSVGIAATKFVAKVASDFAKPDGLTLVPPGTEPDFLWPLDVSRLWGVGPKTASLLKGLGLERIGDVARADPSWLSRRLGSLGEHIYLLSRGEDDREVVPERDPKSIGAEVTFEEDVAGSEALRPHLRRAAQRVARRLREAGLTAGGVRVKLKTSSFRLLTRQARVRPPTDSEKEILGTAETLLSAFDLSVPMRLAGLAAFDLRARDARLQGDLFEPDGPRKSRELDKTLDSLREKFGDGAIRWGGDGE